jgi:hypothetical protein
MNSNRHMNSIPAVCNRCGFTFASSFSLDNSRNSMVIGCGINCPKCGGDARVLDSFTDSQGHLHIRDLFNYLQNYKDTRKLEELKHSLEAANESITAVELANALAEIEPGFEKFKNLIRSIPGNSISNFINTLVQIILLLIAYQTWQSTEENYHESMEVQRVQLEFSREQFEYQKQQDKNNRDSQKQTEKEREEIKRQIEALKAEFERKLKEVGKKSSIANQQRTSKYKSNLKGNCRNKPCPCGSGMKAKKCHPNGF